jgi:hypothetical protein
MTEKKPSNKQGWFYVWDFRSWYCRDYGEFCTKCRETISEYCAKDDVQKEMKK